jgi:hypothetical protein
MKLTKKQLQGLATGLQIGGAIAQTLDSDRDGLDDELGRDFQVAGLALAQLSTGDAVSKKEKAAQALKAIGDACNAIAADILAGG